MLQLPHAESEHTSTPSRLFPTPRPTSKSNLGICTLPTSRTPRFPSPGHVSRIRTYLGSPHYTTYASAHPTHGSRRLPTPIITTIVRLSAS
ncbi:hypothetical protein M011DRAFT_472142 [Sporormia fimetaria CBS 119925]|uniref:Uncharacterized protein n=1 Tax=Sporormia fimetaria CBS 119925 TaxID=1340428 RepID=A0A6A6UWB2_9PLEO|nr:hypothetical protein M011DRAFT_472142 [Sporormia fimetaria CBS 119925]